MADAIWTDPAVFEERTIPEPNTGCWLWLGGMKVAGRGQRATVGRKYASRVAWLLFRGPVPDGRWVLHRCDNGMCVNPAHLFLGTVQDNNADMVRKGRHLHGPRHHMAQLSVEAAKDILLGLLRGERQADAGARHGITDSGVQRVRYGQTHVARQALRMLDLLPGSLDEANPCT